MSLPPPFVVFSLPRSRSYWMSRFLSYGGFWCGHDEILHLRSLEDIRSFLAIPYVGACETAGGSWWRLLAHYRPDARVALVRRDPAAVVASLLATGVAYDIDKLARRMFQGARKLEQIAARWPGALVLDYDDLETEAGCKALFEHCLPVTFDAGWWAHLRDLRLTIDTAAQFRYYTAHRSQLDRVTAIARHKTLSLMQPTAEAEDGVEFHVEPYSEALLMEGLPLLKDHLVLMNQSPDDWDKRNLSLYRTLQEIGALHCMTARCNGRLFGYLVSVVSPSLDRRERTEALHGIFFASPAVRNLGMRLQRAAAADLKAHGVSDLFMRTGARTADAPRLGAIYRRMGAALMGEMYKLPLQDEAA